MNPEREPRPRLRRFVLATMFGLACAESVLRVAGGFYLRRFHAEAAGPADAMRIVCLGESSTVGLWLPREDSYPGQLEAALRLAYAEPRIQAVVPPHVGQNTSQMAHRIEAYLDEYQPLLIVVMAGYNNEWSLAESEIGRFLESPWERSRAQLLVQLEGLRLFRLLRYVALRAGQASPRREYVFGDPELVRYPPAPAVYAFAEAHREAFVALWRHDVGRILAAARSRRVPTVLMTYHINPSYLAVGEVERLAGEKGAKLVRNDQSFARAAERRGAEALLFHDRWHPNRLGYSVIARGAFEAIVGGDLLGLGVVRSDPWPEARAVTPPIPPGGLRLDRLEAEPWLGRGWSRPEVGFRWTEGTRAELHFGRPGSLPVILAVRVRPFVVPGRLDLQRALLSLNGQPLTEWRLTSPEPRTWRGALASESLQDDNVLAIDLPDAAAPRDHHAGPDERHLALAVESIALEEVPFLPPGQVPSEAMTPFLGAGWVRDEHGLPCGVAQGATILARSRPELRQLVLRVRPCSQLTSERLELELFLDQRRLRSATSRGGEVVELKVTLPRDDRVHTLRIGRTPSDTSGGLAGDLSERLPAFALLGMATR